jgi:hypothetical protein
MVNMNGIIGDGAWIMYPSANAATSEQRKM